MQKGSEREIREAPSRMDIERERQEEIARINKTYRMAWKSPLDVDNIPEGYEYFWARESLQGVPDRNRVDGLIKRGWSFVPSSWHPELDGSDVLNRHAEFKGYIYNQGLILMKRPIEFGDRERAYIANHNMMVEKQMPGLEGFIQPVEGKFVVNEGANRSF
ncbi:MAG TPA: hypothetical protein VIJ14_00435 [Rhabdochlamydiaceae bacterium]